MAELYNATGSVRKLVGNWQEEVVLKDATGTARCKLTVASGSGTSVASSAVHEPTFQRVIQHTEHVKPEDWKPSSTDSFQPPTNRSDLLSYAQLPACGPRQAQELKQLMQQAATREPSQPDEPNWETTYQSEHQAKTMEGLQIGCKVMKADGSPANRDPVFLQETGLVPTAGRLMTPGGAGRSLNKVPSFGYVRPPGGCSTDTAASSGLTSSSMDPAVPITMYTEAAAKSTYTGSFYSTACLGKGLMNRNDQFTKLMGDVNKNPHLL